MTYCDRCIIKVVLVVNPSKSYITPITTDYINNCEKYYVHSIAQFAKTNFKGGIKYVPIMSATVRPLENLPLGNPFPKSIPYHGRFAWAKLLLRYLLFPTSERESPNMNCTVLQLYPSMAIPRTVTIIVSITRKFMMFDISSSFQGLQVVFLWNGVLDHLRRFGFKLIYIWRSNKSCSEIAN